jgi:hypothetical protein
MRAAKLPDGLPEDIDNGMYFLRAAPLLDVARGH